MSVEDVRLLQQKLHGLEPYITSMSRA